MRWAPDAWDRRRGALREYLRGALWVLPTASACVALIVGAALSKVRIGTHSPLHRLVFQGTADDARSLLIGISATVITVIALVLGLTVVALQLSSTQFSPRLLRNFLRDRPNQLMLSAFVATFAYCMAGLYTVGVSSGERTTNFPRLAVSGAIVLMFVSLGALVYNVHHLAHSMQIDEIMRRVERGTTAVIQRGPAGTDADPPAVPSDAVAIPATLSGYVQTVHPEPLLDAAAGHGTSIAIAHRVGDHVVAGTPLAWTWPALRGRPGELPHAVHVAVRIGFERTLEQDAAFGLRQLVDIASKALSPAVNDPYTAVQAIDHLAVLLSELARGPHGATVLRSGQSTVVVPGHCFGDYLNLACAQIRRYGASEPTISVALIRLLRATAHSTSDPARRADIASQLDLVLADAEREIAQPADIVGVRDAATDLRAYLTA